MLNAIANIAKIETLLAKMSTARFNAVLPVNIDVKEKIDPTRYMLQIGNKQISTKSLINLEIGAKYWGVLKEDVSANTVNLSGLFKKPKFLQLTNQSFIPQFDQNSLEKLFSKENPKSELKALLLQNLSNAASKSEFVTLSNMLLALNENVFSFILKEENKSAVFQFKKRKKSAKSNAKEDVSLEFYAAFEHLGPINGIVEVIKNEKKLILNLHYENSVNFLKKELKNLDMIITLNQDNNINPLHELSNSLLDIKG